MTVDELFCKLDRVQIVVDMIVDRLAKIEQRLDGVSPTAELQERLERMERRQERIVRAARYNWSDIVSALHDVWDAVGDFGDAVDEASSSADKEDQAEDDN